MALAARGMDPMRVIEKLGGRAGSTSTQSVEAIQRALDLAGSGFYLGGAFEWPGATGSAVVLPPGEWYHEDLIVPNNVSLLGMGRTVSSLRAVSGTAVGVRLHSSSTMGDLFMRAANVTDTIIEAVRARIHVHGIHIHGDSTTAKGIVVDPEGSASYAAQFSDILLESVGGVAVTSAMSDCEWSNLWIGSGAGVGLTVTGSENAFTNLHVWGRETNGCVISGNQNRIANGYIETNFQNGAVINGRGNRFGNVDFWKNGDSGAVVAPSPTPGSGEFTKFAQCSFRENKTAAGLTIGGKYTSVEGCHFMDPDFDATWAIREEVGDYGSPDYTVIAGTCFGKTSDFSAGLVSLLGPNSTSAMVAI